MLSSHQKCWKLVPNLKIKHQYLHFYSEWSTRGPRSSPICWYCWRLQMDCYVLDLGASIVRFNQSQHSIWYLDQWECSTLAGRQRVMGLPSLTDSHCFICLFTEKYFQKFPDPLAEWEENIKCLFVWILGDFPRLWWKYLQIKIVQDFSTFISHWKSL